MDPIKHYAKNKRSKPDPNYMEAYLMNAWLVMKFLEEL